MATRGAPVSQYSEVPCFYKLFMESALLKAKFGKFMHRPILAQFRRKKGDVGP